MKIPVGFRIQMMRVAFGIDLTLPDGHTFDFPIIGLVMHECPFDYTLNIGFMGIAMQISWLKKVEFREED